ncbi:MAG: alginate export family protein [Colwelliaceae bacterium]|jgi:hypothetical protein|nr:alginate export family protein [Colwelliaceae bacterium]
MKTKKLTLSNLALTTLVLSSSSTLASESASKTSLDMNLRYESVSQDNNLKDADALTLRTRLTYQSKSLNGFSGLIEFEDSRVVSGFDDYNNAAGKNGGVYSVIADPETTELDQAFVQYKNDKLVAKIGRQVITLDGHRFIGHVGWRQDRQTFDAASFSYSVNKQVKTSYSYITKRNRIFADIKDIDSNDHLFNISYQSSLGKIVGYSYLLEEDNANKLASDTFGISLSGKKDKLSYYAEFASQNKSQTNLSDFTASYTHITAGYSFDKVTAKLGLEILGSDDGMYGFSTPLATLHKFNGWSDQFLGTPKEGLVDVYASISGKAFSGKWLFAYHDFSADEKSNSVDDLGSEINAVYTKKLAKNYVLGIKAAMYSAGDIGTGKVDTDKVWLWVSAKF